MSDLKISEIASGGTVTSNDKVPSARSGANKSVVFGTAAALDTGTGIGDVVKLEDSGGAALPAVKGHQLTGIPSPTQVFDWNPFFLANVTDGSYRLIINCSFAGVINEITTRSTAGTGTLTGKINTTALGGTANSVSTSEQTQTHSSSNAFVAGDDIVLEVSSASALENMSVKIKYTRVLATT